MFLLQKAAFEPLFRKLLKEKTFLCLQITHEKTGNSTIDLYFELSLESVSYLIFNQCHTYKIDIVVYFWTFFTTLLSFGQTT